MSSAAGFVRIVLPYAAPEPGREFLPAKSGYRGEVRLPRELVARALVNDWPAPATGEERVVLVEGAFANGDAAELRVRRVGKDSDAKTFFLVQHLSGRLLVMTPIGMPVWSAQDPSDPTAVRFQDAEQAQRFIDQNLDSSQAHVIHCRPGPPRVTPTWVREEVKP